VGAPAGGAARGIGSYVKLGLTVRSTLEE
jgi:hypothetical protein